MRRRLLTHVTAAHRGDCVPRTIHFLSHITAVGLLAGCAADPAATGECRVEVIMMPAQIAAPVDAIDTVRAVMTSTCALVPERTYTFTSTDTTVGRVRQLSDTTAEVTSVRAGYAAVVAWLGSPPMVVAFASLQVEQARAWIQPKPDCTTESRCAR